MRPYRSHLVPFPFLQRPRDTPRQCPPGVLWIEYIRKHDRPDYKRLFVWAWLAPIVMSGVIELLQEYCTETRNGDWLDLTANALGVTLGAVFGLIVLKMRKEK